MCRPAQTLLALGALFSFFFFFSFCVLQLNQNLHDVLLGLDKQYSGNAFPVKAQPRSVTVEVVPFPWQGRRDRDISTSGIETSMLSVGE